MKEKDWEKIMKKAILCIASAAALMFAGSANADHGHRDYRAEFHYESGRNDHHRDHYHKGKHYGHYKHGKKHAYWKGYRDGYHDAHYPRERVYYERHVHSSHCDHYRKPAFNSRVKVFLDL